MRQPLTERYRERLPGVLSCYDRIIVTGTLPGACYAKGMTGFLSAADPDLRLSAICRTASRRQVPSVRRRSLCISLFAVGRGIEAVREALPTVLASVPPPAVLTRDFPVETERRPGVQMGSVQT